MNELESLIFQAKSICLRAQLFNEYSENSKTSCVRRTSDIANAAKVIATLTDTSADLKVEKDKLGFFIFIAAVITLLVIAAFLITVKSLILVFTLCLISLIAGNIAIYAIYLKRKEVTEAYSECSDYRKKLSYLYN